MLAISGIGGAAATAAARALLDAGVSALMAFGTAGGLDPQLAAGSLVLPAEIIAAEGSSWVRTVTASAWRERLSARFSAERPVAGGRVLTSAQPVETVAAKAALFRDTGAVAVDMESAAVARVAAEHIECRFFVCGWWWTARLMHCRVRWRTPAAQEGCKWAGCCWAWRLRPPISVRC